MTLAGGGQLILSASNTYTGVTTISGGTLQLGDGTGNNGSVAGNITDNAHLTFANPYAQTYTGAISGSGGLTKTAAGLLILTGSNTYSGATTISAGTLQVGSSGTAGSIGNTSGVTDNGLLEFALTGSTTFAPVISGSGGLLQAGSGALILIGAKTYSGPTTISAGTLQFGNGVATGSITSSSAVSVGSGVLAFDNTGTTTFGPPPPPSSPAAAACGK